METPWSLVDRDHVPYLHSAMDQFEELQAWCLGPQGRGAAARSLRRTRLSADPGAVDDLCQQVFIKVWQRLQRGPLDGPAHTSAVEAYAEVTVRNAANDLIRRGARDRLDELTDPTKRFGLIEHLDEESDPDSGTGAQPSHIVGQPVRWALHAHLAERQRRLQPWTIAAALVFVELADHPDLELLADTPRPHRQSRASHDGAGWAALAYAGRIDCFTQPETSAVRERRSTALARMRTALVAAAEAAGATS